MNNPNNPGLQDLTQPPPGVSSVPKSIDVALTGRCNLSCRYCFYADSMQSKNDLPTERWVQFFTELGNLCIQRVCLSGGEIFLRPDLYALIDSIIQNRMRYSILSNGTLITEEVITALSEGKRRIRLDSIQISVDGSCPEIHNLSRPKDSFNRALYGLRLLMSAKFPVTVRVTLNRHNIHDLENIARLLLEDIGLPGFSTNEVEAMGTARCQGENIILSDEERKMAMIILEKLHERYRGRISASAGPLAIFRVIKEIHDCIAHGDREISGRGTLCSCGGVFSQLAVLHDGTMVPCNLLPTLVMGVIGMHSLQDTWLHSPAINAVRIRRQIPLSLLPDCKDCEYTGFCSGGCPASVMAKTGRLIGIDPLLCYKKYKDNKVI